VELKGFGVSLIVGFYDTENFAGQTFFDKRQKEKKNSNLRLKPLNYHNSHLSSYAPLFLHFVDFIICNISAG